MRDSIAWTGGTDPRPLRGVSAEERTLVRTEFRESMAAVFSYFGDYRGLYNTALESARGHWRRARYDAHSTYRED